MVRPEESLNARSRRTRGRLLAAAREILESDGFDALTMRAVADRAGVTRRSVYLHFPSRTDLVGSLFDFFAEAEGLDDSLSRVWSAPDPSDALAEWARHLARYHLRLLPFDRAISRVQHVDADAAAHRRRVSAAKHGSCRRLAAWLQDEHVLAPGWTVETAADMIDALSTSDVIERLLVERGWSTRRFEEHLGLLLRSTFIGPSVRSG